MMEHSEQVARASRDGELVGTVLNLNMVRII